MHAAISFHKKYKLGNSGVCLFGKYHDVLYVAANLCYSRNLPDTDTVSTLLQHIYECEKTFEKFFECAIFGAKVTQLISGWRSYYKSPTENLNACIYFLQHATKGRLTFPQDGDSGRRFVDIPMNCYENLSPLKTAVKAEKWDIVILLIKYGAITYLPFMHEDFEKFSIFQLFVEKLEKCGPNLFGQSSMVESFKIFIRSIPTIYAVWQPEEVEEDTRIVWLMFMQELRLEDVEEPRSLKHLAKCATRDYLAKMHLLPASVEVLHIPKVLERYINLETD